jgi:hypothetical protein
VTRNWIERNSPGDRRRENIPGNLTWVHIMAMAAMDDREQHGGAQEMSAPYGVAVD